MLRTETKLTCRVDRLPDDYSFSKKGWRREQIELDAIIFDGAEYVKDGLLPITEWLGQSPWSERAIGIIDDIWKNAPIETPFGKIPTLNFEVNGDLLQACSRLFWFTGERKYLDWAIRLGDYYLLGDHHPTRDMKELKLGDHSCEVINGLSELYVACAHAAPEKREAYRKPLHEMYDRILANRLQRARPDLPPRQHPDRRTLSTALTDNWGYNYDGLYTAYLLDKKTAYRDAVRKALGNLKEHYTGQGGMCQSRTADGYADSIEGAITLLNREPVPSAAEWVDAEIKTMWGRQHPERRHRGLARRRQLRAHLAHVRALEDAGHHHPSRGAPTCASAPCATRGRSASASSPISRGKAGSSSTRQRHQAEHAPAARLPAHQPVPRVVHGRSLAPLRTGQFRRRRAGRVDRSRTARGPGRASQSRRTVASAHSGNLALTSPGQGLTGFGYNGMGRESALKPRFNRAV